MNKSMEDRMNELEEIAKKSLEEAELAKKLQQARHDGLRWNGIREWFLVSN